MEVLATFNAGSSSLKFSVCSLGRPSPQLLARGHFADFSGEGAGGVLSCGGPADADLGRPAGNQEQATHAVLDWITRRPDWHLVAAGHRIVHGGRRRHHAPIDDELLAQLKQLRPLAPLHLPANLEAVAAVRQSHPRLPQVACFDTAFHGVRPESEQRPALERDLVEEGIRNYGFHGLSYESICRLWPGATGGPLPSRLLVAHLGNGASACAIRDGLSVATTMGFPTLNGLVMGTRSGSIDPGILLYLMRTRSWGHAELEHSLYNRSGMLGVSQLSSDMRALLASKDVRAAEAVELFCRSAARHLGRLAVAIGGLDALVFTGGIGENAPSVRARIADDLSFLGVAVDARANAANETSLSAAGAAVQTWRLETDEEAMIASHTLGLGT